MPITHLLTPADPEMHNVQTPEEYQQLQVRILQQVNTRRNQTDQRVIWTFVGEQPPVYVAMGKWVLRCSCGNAPSVHPDWHIARCFECGAVYLNVMMPAQAREIERVLIERPMAHRGWLPSESVEDLQADNERHGHARGAL
jgi:hypothetical protein